MKKSKKFFNATIATAVAASGVVAVAPAVTEASTTFSDVKATDYYSESIQNLQARGIIKGFEDGTFRPNQAVTRGQVAKILAGALSLDTTNVKNPSFKDIPQTHQYYGAIAALANAGIISGFEDGTFRAGDTVQRNHMAKMIANGFGLQAGDTVSPFTDVRADYASFITALFANGVTTGKTATTFDGTSHVTRGQLATFVVRAENQAVAVSSKEATLTINSVEDSVVKTADGDFTVAKAVASLFKESNAAALNGAQVKAIVKGNEIVEVINVTLQATSTAATPLTFDGGNATISNNFTVKSAFTTIKNVTAKGTVIVDAVAVAPVASLNAVAADLQQTTVTLENVAASTVEVKRDGVTVNSNTKIASLTVATDVKTLTLNAVVGQLTVPATAKITLASTAKIDQLVLPEGAKIQNVIANYNSVKANIGAIVDTKGTPVKVTSGGGGGGGGSSSNTGGTTTPETSTPGTTTPEVTTPETPTPDTEKEPEKKPDVGEEPDKDKEEFPETGEGPGPDPNPNGPDEEVIIGEITGEKISQAGTYGPETGNRVIEGNLIIESEDVTLRNVTVTGQLILAASIGEGDVHLQGVTVEGETIVKGGGQNSIYFKDSVLATVIVNKNNGAVRIIAQGSTQVVEVQLESPTIVEEQNLATGSVGFEDIVVTEALQTGATSADAVQVELRGVFETINSRVANVRIQLSEETDIQTLILNAAARVLGTGTIQLAQINASGSTLSQRPQNLVLDTSAYVTIGEGDNSETLTESYSDENAEATVTGIRAAQGVIHVDMTQFIAGLTTSDFEVEATVRDAVATADTSDVVVTTTDSGHIVTTNDSAVVELSNLYYDATKKRFTFEPLDVQQYKDQVIEIRVTPKHEKLSTETVIAAYTVSTGFGGRITDVLEVGIPNLRINFRAGAGTTTGDVVGFAVTDDYGYYTIDLPAGVYTGEFSSAGYVTTYLVANAASDYYLLDQNETAIRAAASEEIKIMLSWGERPYDLDSHLQGPNNNGDKFHIYYSQQQAIENGIIYADLDWDDTDSYGPETTTIRKLVDGEYRFFVHNYSQNPGISTSNAKVSVFLGNAVTPTQTFTVPTSDSGELYWDVFDLLVSNNGETVAIRAVNKLTHNRQSVDEMIREGYYWDINIPENATIEQKVAAVQRRVDELNLPEGTNPVVSYEELTERYIVSYTRYETTYTVAITPYFLEATVENLLSKAFQWSINLSADTTQADRLVAVQDVVNQVEFLSNEVVTVAYDAIADQFNASYEKDGEVKTVMIYPSFYIWDVTGTIQSAFYNGIELQSTTDDAGKIAIIQNILDGLDLPEGIEPVVASTENSWMYTISFAINDWTSKVDIYPDFYVPSVYSLIQNAVSGEFPISVNTDQAERVGKLQAVLNDLQLPEGTNATVVVNEYKEYSVEYNEDGYLNTVYISPYFEIIEEIFTTDELVNITSSDSYLDESLTVEGIEFIGGTTADTTLVTFDSAEVVTITQSYNPYGLIFSFDKNKAAGIDLSAVEKVIITARSDYGYEQTFEVNIAQ